jgi:hypothetical protein
MLYSDLSAYSYELPRPLPGVLNVGWLDEGAYPRRDPTDEFVARLANVIVREQVNVLRCTSPCPLCGKDGIWVHHAGVKFFLGAAEVWIPSDRGSLIYAAPDLIWHYVHEHKYSPPSEFVDAVLGFDLKSSWLGEQLREELERKLYL